jgi:hypothetical protein
VTTLDNPPQVTNIADRRTRMYPVQEEQFRPVERAESG